MVARWTSFFQKVVVFLDTHNVRVLLHRACVMLRSHVLGSTRSRLFWTRHKSGSVVDGDALTCDSPLRVVR